MCVFELLSCLSVSGMWDISGNPAVDLQWGFSTSELPYQEMQWAYMISHFPCYTHIQKQ